MPINAPFPSGKNLEALRLSLEAAHREADFWFLPYIPNPTLSAGLSYNVDTQALEWNFSVGLSVDVIDRGERANESLMRKKSRTLSQLELEDALRTSRRATEDAWKEKEVLWLNYQIAVIEKEEEMEDFQTAEQLKKGEFISEEEYELQELNYRNAVLSERRAYHTYLLQVLRLLNEYDIKLLLLEGKSDVL